MTEFLRCDNVSKTYGTGNLAQPVLAGVSVSINRGETCVLLGPSGSGKTTLLSILGCMLSPTSGTLAIGNEQVDFRSQRYLLPIRRKHIGFVFQQPQLLAFLTMEENICVASHYKDLKHEDTSHASEELLRRLGILHLKKKKPAEASVGERQRVSIARALSNRPSIILADEPTASLDWENGQQVVQLLVEQAKYHDALLLTVTHDTRLLAMFDRIFHIEKGTLVEQ